MSRTFIGEALPKCGASPLYKGIIKLECDVSYEMHVRILSSWRAGILVFSCVHCVEAIQDPGQVFKVKIPESQMPEVVIYVSSALLTTCLALVQLGSCEAQH